VLNCVITVFISVLFVINNEDLNIHKYRLLHVLLLRCILGYVLYFVGMFQLLLLMLMLPLLNLCSIYSTDYQI
jgi:hypothetical protein